MAAFLDVDLEDVAQIVERGRSLAEVAMLLDRSGLGIALDHDQAAQHGAILARHVLPSRLTVMVAERNFAILLGGREQNAPAIIGHLYVVELGPALGIDRHRGAQIDERLLEAVRPHAHPPVNIAGMPALERTQHLAILDEIDVVRNLGRIIDGLNGHDHFSFLVPQLTSPLSCPRRRASSNHRAISEYWVPAPVPTEAGVRGNDG